MVCSVCFECGHNKRTCPFQPHTSLWTTARVIVPLTSDRDIPTDLEMKIDNDLLAISDDPTSVEVKIANDLLAILV